MKRLPLLMSLLALIALSASIAYWVLQLYKPAQRPLAPAPMAALPDPSPDAAATLFGGQAVAVVATTYQLTGVVYAGNESVAILQAEGQPSQALPMGKEIAPGVKITEVHPRYVMLSEGGILKRIELATDAKANASVNILPPGGMAPPQTASPAPTPAPPQPQPPQVPMGGNEMTGGNPRPPAAPSEPPPPPPQQQQMPPPTRTMSPQQPTE
jgi:general secretion pathway protein C